MISEKEVQFEFTVPLNDLPSFVVPLNSYFCHGIWSSGKTKDINIHDLFASGVMNFKLCVLVF